MSAKHQVISKTERSGKSYIEDAASIEKAEPKILCSLKERPHRHEELRRNVGSVFQRILTRTLRNLESTGLITRFSKTRQIYRKEKYKLGVQRRNICAQHASQAQQ